MRTIAMNKGAHRFVFRYVVGGECDVLEAVAELAADPENPFDWLDAASVSFQVTSEQASSCVGMIDSVRKLA